METLADRRTWTDVLQVLRDCRCQSTLLYLAIVSITIDRENNIFHNKAKFKHYLSANLTLQKVIEKKPSNLRTVTTPMNITTLQ